MQTILHGPVRRKRQTREFTGVSDDRYTVKLAANPREVESALHLRYEVFNVELRDRALEPGDPPIEFDAYDFKCRHLIVISKITGETVGTYRLNSIETADSVHGFYSSNEFTVEDLPKEVLVGGLEIGRACIAAAHRNTKVLFLLWKALLAYLERSGKRYFFGCCSIFTQDLEVGRQVYRQIIRDGHLDESFSVLPRRNGISLVGGDTGDHKVELPGLFNMYLRIGARVCSPPMVDREFGTIDFLVVFDVTQMNEKYRRMFS
jgi:putative hemolysin